jgi:hypothetical protein
VQDLPRQRQRLQSNQRSDELHCWKTHKSFITILAFY